MYKGVKTAAAIPPLHTNEGDRVLTTVLNCKGQRCSYDEIKLVASCDITPCFWFI